MTSFSPESEPVNCDTALERLECVWIDPIPDEPLDAETSAALEHVRQCSACWAAFEKRRECDSRLAMMMQTVPVPPGLREQLLARASETFAGSMMSDNNVSKTGREQIVDKRQSIETPDRRNNIGDKVSLRRRAWAIATAATMLVATASGSWLWFAMQGRSVSVQTLCEVTPMTSNGLLVVEDLAQLPALPQSWMRMKGMKIVGTPRWFQPPGLKVPASWIPFELRLQRSKPIQGVLLMLLRENVTDPPRELVGQSSFLKYEHRAGKSLSIAGWSEQGVVYLCFVNDEPAALERLMKLTVPTAA